MNAASIGTIEIETAAVQAFFDRLAPAWDSGRITREDILREIMGLADITPGCRVLDVACGTGVLFPWYLARGAAAVTGVDLSPAMIRAAAAKYQDERLTLLAGDVEQLELGLFDRIVVLNALPHFPDPGRLIARLAEHLVPGGRLTVAHDRPRPVIDGVHQQTASEVSRGMLPAQETAGLFAACLHVDTVIEDSRRYIVSGTATRYSQRS